MEHSVRENWPFRVDTTQDKSGRLWVTLIFLEPPDETTEIAYGFDANAADLLISSLKTARGVLDTN
jgi:hypothetical protein